ncbi:hypothetical protein B0H10DRAFT_994097 [Mycena sp. CBHHK59/15]|nr:hypothetical protein B0H10DRAFT_994097 [Mycena sp. CBHHK59/15]
MRTSESDRHAPHKRPCPSIERSPPRIHLLAPHLHSRGESAPPQRRGACPRGRMHARRSHRRLYRSALHYPTQAPHTQLLLHNDADADAPVRPPQPRLSLTTPLLRHTLVPPRPLTRASGSVGPSPSMAFPRLSIVPPAPRCRWSTSGVDLSQRHCRCGLAQLRTRAGRTNEGCTPAGEAVSVAPYYSPICREGGPSARGRETATLAPLRRARHTGQQRRPPAR